jgi:hypothetical protein
MADKLSADHSSALAFSTVAALSIISLASSKLVGSS